MSIRDIHLKHSPQGPPLLTAEECTALIEAKITPEEHRAFGHIADNMAIRGIGAQGIEELALRLTALFLATGEEKVRLPPTAGQLSRRREKCGTRPLRELVSEEP